MTDDMLNEIMMINGMSDIMSISRLRMGTDGDGVTTLVGFWGCPLKCAYCINEQCHRIGEERASFTPEELIEVLRKDEIYYLMSGGGVTFGGGEPLLQADFIHKVCALANPNWKMRIETSLNVEWEKISLLLEDIDEWIIDIKDWDYRTYRKYTKVPISQMKENLKKLFIEISKEKIHIRMPIIPEYNTEESVNQAAELIKRDYGIDPEVFEYICFKR